MNIKQQKEVKNLMLAGIQAQNGIAEEKWDDVKITLNKIDQ